MTQIGEGVANPTTETEEPQDDKEHVKIRFCLFFDGTLNNRTNVEQRLASADGTRELHVVRFASEAKLAGFRADPRRAEHAHLLAASGATIDVVVMYDVAMTD